MRWVLIALYAGCYSPHPPAGAPCASGDECPSPLVCAAGTCTEPGGLVPPDADPSCSCTGDTLTCASGATTCVLGCADTSRCIEIVPSNGIDPELARAVVDPITIDGAATFDTDTGAISGAITRAAGTGIAAGIGFVGSDELGVFVIRDLTVTAAGSIRFTGTHAVVLLVGGTATIDGTLDASSGCAGGDPSCAGPGGGEGGVFGTGPRPCGGANGLSDLASTSDTGGGGGGGGGGGAAGGAVQSFVGGAAGASCTAETIEPLVGGGGGGGGGPGATGMPAKGGGGGGAVQLTALVKATISGTIVASGGGGAGGVGNGNGNGGAAGGGGGGGAILVESIDLTLGNNCVLAANGGGGGGGANGADSGKRGQSGQASAIAAMGGASGAAPATSGGAGGAIDAPSAPADLTTNVGNAGGGGGSAGRIRLRVARDTSIDGTISPGASLATATTR